jgi:hypothetical protein
MHLNRPQGFQVQQRRTIAGTVEKDVCFPIEDMSGIAEEDFPSRDQEGTYQMPGCRRRRRAWPDLSVLEEWRRASKADQRASLCWRKTWCLESDLASRRGGCSISLHLFQRRFRKHDSRPNDFRVSPAWRFVPRNFHPRFSRA